MQGRRQALSEKLTTAKQSISAGTGHYKVVLSVGSLQGQSASSLLLQSKGTTNVASHAESRVACHVLYDVILLDVWFCNLSCYAGAAGNAVPVRGGKMEAAISSLIGTPQAAYLYDYYKSKLSRFQGVTLATNGEFNASAPVGRKGAIVKLGRYQTVLAAARAHDAAVFKVYGRRRRIFNFPEEYANAKED